MFRRSILFIGLFIGSFFIFIPRAEAAYGDTTTYLGRIYAGDGGQATAAFLDFPEDLAFDSSGNMYIADTYNNVIRKIDTSGIITTYAGTGSYGATNGARLSAEFALPQGITVDSSGNVYVADTGNNLIRKIDTYGSVSTLISSGLNSPEGIVYASGYLYIADTGNNQLKKYNLSMGTMSTLTSEIVSPRKMDVSPDGAYLYVADSGNYRVVKVATTSGAISVIAGSGTAGYKEGVGTAAQFRMVYGIGLDRAANVLYVTDEDADRIAMIRKIDLSNNETSQFVYDTSMTAVHTQSGIRMNGNYIYLAGTGTIHRYNKNDANDNEVVAGSDRFGFRNGTADRVLLGRPYDMVLSPDRQYIYLAENNKIRRINRASGETTFIIGNSVDSYDHCQGIADQARFSNISGITISPDGDTLYITDRWNNRIRGINIAEQSSFLVSGTGQYNVTGSGNGYQEGNRNTARFDIPANLVISPDGNYLYVTDTGNHRIRKVRISDGQTWLIAGSGEAGFADGIGASAKFNSPYGITIDDNGQYLYVADRDNHRIRRVRIADGQVTTIAGSGRAGYRDGIGTNAVLSYPVYVEYYLNKVFFTEAGSHRVRVIELDTNVTKLVSGSGERGYKNGTRKETEFNNLTGLVIDPVLQYLYVADSWNDVIRRIYVAGIAPYTETAPVISNVAPNVLQETSDPDYQAYLDIYGQNFRYGIKTEFYTYVATSYVKSENQMTVVIPLGQMSPGWYDVRVTNLDGQSDVKEMAFAVASSSGSIPSIIYSIESVTGFEAYMPLFRGGIRAASGDLDGDGIDEVITSTNSGGGPHLRIFDREGNLVSQFMAYHPAFRGGFYVAAGDVDGDGLDEIITGAGPGGGPHVRIFDINGNLESQFFAYMMRFRGGVKVAAGDVDGDGIDEIITGAGRGGGPHVRVFNMQGEIKGQFFAYAEILHTGITVATGDVDGDGINEIITGTAREAAPHVRIFNSQGIVESQFFAFAESSREGVNVAAGDINRDGLEEIITTKDKGSPRVVIYNYRGEVVE